MCEFSCRWSVHTQPGFCVAATIYTQGWIDLNLELSSTLFHWGNLSSVKSIWKKKCWYEIINEQKLYISIVMQLAAHTSSQYMHNIIPDILKVKYMPVSYTHLCWPAPEQYHLQQFLLSSMKSHHLVQLQAIFYTCWFRVLLVGPHMWLNLCRLFIIYC